MVRTDITGRVIRSGLLSVALLCVSLSAMAFTPQSMRFDRLSIEDGLSQSNVKAIVQDSTGFLWFATENGLNRYDGNSFRQYRRDRTSHDTLESDFVHDVSLDASGNLWIATDGGGVARWNAANDNFTIMRHDPDNPGSLADDNVLAVLADSRGWVWMGTRHNGLDRLDIRTGEITHYRHNPDDPSTLSHNDIFDVTIGPEGEIWIGTQGGLDRLDPESGEIVRFQHNPREPLSLSDNVVQALLVDEAGTLWVGTRTGGLNRFDKQSSGFERFAHDEEIRDSLSDDSVQVIFEDSDRRLWVGTSSGLHLMNRQDGSFKTYVHDPTDNTSLSNDNVVSMFQDRSGVLWVGTKFSGISKWNPRSWSFGHHEARQGEPGGLSSSHITSFTEDHGGRLWIGTFGGGLNILHRSTGTTDYMRHDPRDLSSLSADRVMALVTDRAGMIWVGTMGGGLNRIDPLTRETQVYRHDPDDPNSLAANAIMSLFEDSVGRIWVGTFGGGVSRLDEQDGRFTNFPPDPDNPTSLSGGRATAITEDARGTVWVGTDGGGLNALNPATGNWRRFLNDATDPASLSANTVYALHVDARNQLWIGTRAGLDRFVREPGQPVHFESLTQRDGLDNDTIYGVRSDRNGQLWLSTNYGLVRFNPSDGQIRNFHRSHGLQDEEFNFGAHYANVRGELFFGGSNGFNVFDPARLELNTTPPPVVLTAFAKLNSPVQTSVPYENLASIDLAYSDDVVSLEFSALDFVAAEQNRYAYMLAGFDKDWVDAGSERRFSYTNLDAGQYSLRVKAANSDGVWSEPIELPFHVAAPPWRSWWAYLLYVLGLGAAVFWYIRSQQLKLEREAEYNRRLRIEVQERTQELAERNEELQVANLQLHQASHTDALTGLRNRRYLFDEISKDIDLVQRNMTNVADGRRRSTNSDIVFVVVDLDRFKPVNDNLGHVAGDEMLLQVRDAMLEACRSSDVVIRWGGDEFLVVARDTSREDAAKLVERIRSRIEEHVFALGHGSSTRTTCSIGFAAYPFLKERPDLFDWEQVLNIADIAMYRAKEYRNAWSGIYCAHWNGSSEELLTSIKADAPKLAEEGVILMIDSLTLSEQEIA